MSKITEEAILAGKVLSTLDIILVGYFQEALRHVKVYYEKD